jgi:hypothetical protein
VSAVQKTASKLDLGTKAEKNMILKLFENNFKRKIKGTKNIQKPENSANTHCRNLPSKPASLSCGNDAFVT